MWVRQVFYKASGVNHYGNAEDHINECATLPVSSIKAGMIVCTDDSPTSKYGHIGIYLGNNTVMDNVGYIRTTTLDYWKSYYSKVTPVKCGWYAGVKVTDDTSSTGEFDMSKLPTLSISNRSKFNTSVVCLQASLNAQGYSKLVTDGYFGSETKSAVKTFQSKKGITVDGICGKNTWSKLFNV